MNAVEAQYGAGRHQAVGREVPRGRRWCRRQGDVVGGGILPAVPVDTFALGEAAEGVQADALAAPNCEPFLRLRGALGQQAQVVQPLLPQPPRAALGPVLVRQDQRFLQGELALAQLLIVVDAGGEWL